MVQYIASKIRLIDLYISISYLTVCQQSIEVILLDFRYS